MKTIGILHPGAMGSSVAACLRMLGRPVVWASEGRGEATRARADRSEITDVESVTELFDRSDVVLSVCPPANAAELARSAVEARFEGVYVDCNAISPATARSIADACEAPDRSFVDGGLVGPPPNAPGTTRLFLSGTGASDVADLFSGSTLEAIALDGPVGAASALKMAYAAWTKGSAALLLSIRALASHEGVEEALLDEWDRSVPGLRERSARSGRGTAPKAWRFVAEMSEIEATFENAGLPSGFHQAASEVYARMSDLKHADPVPQIDEILDLILRDGS